MKKIVISESQYKRIFLIEQISPFNYQWDDPTSSDAATVPITDTWEDHPIYEFFKTAYSFFDCGGDLWLVPEEECRELGLTDKVDIEKCMNKNYWHCILDNLSIAVTVVPPYGPMISSVMDAANAIWWGAEFAISCEGGIENCDGYKALYALFSAIGIIPGAREALKMSKISPKTIKSMEKLMLALHKKAGGWKNIKTLKPKDFDNILIKIKKELDLKPKDIENMRKAMESIKEIAASDVVKNYNKQLKEFFESNEMIKRKFFEMADNPYFKKQLDKTGDLLKTLKSWDWEKSLRFLGGQLTITSLLAGGMVGYDAFWKVSTPEKDILKKPDGRLELMTLYKLFNVFDQCGELAMDNYESLSGCNNRKAAMEAYENGLKVNAFTSETDKKCVCDFVTGDDQWDIVINAVKNHNGDLLSWYKDIKDCCGDTECNDYCNNN